MLRYKETNYGALIIWDTENPDKDDTASFVMLQGDDAAYLSDMLASCETDEEEQEILSEYFC